MRAFFRHSLFILAFSVGLATYAFDVPALTGPVVDQVGLLAPQTAAVLSENLQRTLQNSGPQIQVLIVSSLNDESLEEVAIQVFDKWKLGGAKTDNGVLFLIAPNEKKMRVEVGRGLEGDIPDAYAKRIVSDIVSPYFKNGEYDMGVTQGVAAIMHYANAGELQGKIVAQSDRGERRSGGINGKMVGGIIFVLWILLFMFNPTLAIALLFSGRGGRGGGGGGFGGGGGWSGGGGGSSGGGASGSWWRVVKKLKNKIDSAKIEAAITEFEKHVDFELVPVITPKSSYTDHIGWMISLILLLVFVSTIDLFFQSSWASKTNYYIAAPFLAVILGHLIDKSDWIDRFFITKAERLRQCYEKAQRIFFLKQLHELKSHNSIVLFVSVMEKKIIVLPDPRLKLEGLDTLQQDLVKVISQEFSHGRYEVGFLKAIAFLQANLTGPFPKKTQNSENQVSNKLIWWND